MNLDNDNFIYKVSDDFVYRKVAGEHLVIPTGKSASTFNGLITLNEIGIFIWKVLQKGATFTEIVSSVRDSYEVDLDTAKTDVREFLERLENAGILNTGI